MNKKTIINNFSRYAHLYDRYADIQKNTASELLGWISENNIIKILEIGCGTGNYTLLLKDKFKKAELKAIDISEKMITLASQKIKDKRIEFITADAEIFPFFEEFDLITSNACLQWFDNPQAALIKYKNLLKPESLLLFSIFGPATFWELDTILKYILQDVSVSAKNFITQEKLQEVLSQNFKRHRIKEIRYQEHFSCLKELLDKIKYTGMRGEGITDKIFFSQGVLKNLEDTYLDKFQQIKATYQIFLCQAIK